MYQIAVSGASKGKSAKAGAEAAYAVGKTIAVAGHSVFTGATTGLSHQAALGAKSAGGQSIGISPASSHYEHVHTYRLPTDAYDVIIYTGLNYVGRDLLLVQSSDAVISIGGRIGTWHEFTVAIETKKPVAVLEGVGGVGSEFKSFLTAAGRKRTDVIFDDDPARLVARLLDALDKKHIDHPHLHPHLS